jgi:hypothetical protein
MRLMIVEMWKWVDFGGRGGESIFWGCSDLLLEAAMVNAQLERHASSKRYDASPKMG